jgi:twitching motility protein PilT
VLVRRADSRSRRAVCEVMVMNRAIGKLIQTDSSHQIPAQLQTGRDLGMQIMDQALLAGIQAKELDPDDAVNYASDRKLFARFVTDATLAPKLGSADG